MGVDAQGERWVAVAEVFGELLNRDAPGEHDAGVIVPELVEAFPAGGDVAGPAAPVFGRFRDQASFGQSGFPDDFGVVAGLDVLAVGAPAEQDVAGMRFAVQLLPRESAFLRRVLFDVPLDHLDSPVGERYYPFAVVFGQGEYVPTAEIFDLPSDAENLLVKIEVFQGDAEADHPEVKAWAHEIRAWIALTTGNYHGVVAAARAGIEAAPHHSVAIQLSAQEAKAWARIGDRRMTEVALDKGRRLLEAMPYPENLDHHFVVDPTKFDFYAMDCYRHVAEDRLAETLANEVIQASTDFDGTERAPMRLAEARITLGVVAARQGDLEQAIHHGTHALGAPRKSLPSLLMVSRDLTKVLNEQYAAEPETQAYLDQLHALSS